MRYVSIQQTIQYSICKISDIACGPLFWTVLVNWYFHHDMVSFKVHLHRHLYLTPELCNLSLEIKGPFTHRLMHEYLLPD